jgi:hypothetical protein
MMRGLGCAILLLGPTMTTRFLAESVREAAIWLPAIAALYGAHRLAVWAEGRGYIHYRRGRGSSGSVGSAFLEVQALLEPSRRHVLEARVREDVEDEQSGDPPDHSSAEASPTPRDAPARRDDARAPRGPSGPR